MQITSRYASRTSASLGEGHSFIALRFGTCILGFEKLTESVLGKRGSSGKAFCYGSIFGSLFFSYLCGGECLEDINVLIEQFKQRPDTLLPDADTVGRKLKELTEKNIVYKSETSDKSYSFNTTEKLNTLLLRMIRSLSYSVVL